MREADRITIEDRSVASIDLMEQASRALATKLIELFALSRFSIVCGCGNNGGDGLALARLLSNTGAFVSVHLMSRTDLSKDAETNYLRLKDLESENVVLIDGFDSGCTTPDDVLVDAIFGTGLNRELDQSMLRVIEEINNCDCKATVSVDIPSGLNGKTGKAMPATVRASHTLTLATLKSGLLLNEGPLVSGEVFVLDIGIEKSDIDRVAREFSSAKLVSVEEALAAMPSKLPGHHKFSRGEVISVTGSADYPGAAILSSMASMRVGCGFVHSFVPQVIEGIVNSRGLELVVHALGEKGDDILRASSKSEIDLVIKDSSTLLLGCGLGRKAETQSLVRSLVRDNRNGVLDADGINAFEGRTDELKSLNIENWILTPHSGELRRLVDEDRFESHASPIDLVRGLAQEWSTNILLKGAPLILADPVGQVFLMEGSPEFSTAGTGDVLAGMIAGLMSQSLDPIEAGLCALGIGRESIWSFKEKYPYLSLVASDLISDA